MTKLNQNSKRNKYCYTFRDILDVLKQEKVVDKHVLSMREIEDELQGIRLKYVSELDKDVSDKKYKIPPILHVIWFTSADNPREISQHNIDKILNNAEMLQLNGQPWKLILWTNDHTLIPNTTEQLKEFEVKHFDEVTFSNPVIRQNLVKAIKAKDYGIASDHLRYPVLKEYGGLYTDVDQKFFGSLDKFMKTYHLFSNLEAAEFNFISNGVVAAVPNHPIIDKALEAIERNMVIQENTPNYAKYPCNLFEKSVLASGPGMWSATFYNNAHQKGMKDIVFDRHVLCGGTQAKDHDPLDENYNSTNIPSIGFQDNKTTWLKKGDGDLIKYDNDFEI